jgi:uncharacterized membrane protein YidH (DUF202 family)
MPSAADPPRDPGLAVERTALAWQRMAMSFTSLAAVVLAAAAHRDALWMLGPAAGLFAVGGAVWRYARRRTRDPSARVAREALALLAAAVIAAAVVAAALATMRAA